MRSIGRSGISQRRENCKSRPGTSAPSPSPDTLLLCDVCRPGPSSVPSSQTARARRVIPPDEWAGWPDEKLLDLRISELGVTIEGSAAREPRIAELQAELDARGPDISAAFLVIGRMVLARWRPRRGDPLLPRASAAGAARAGPDARGRGRHARVVHEDPAPRGRTRDRQRLQAAAAAPAAADLRPVLHAVSRVLHAEAVQQELRAASRQLVRAEPSRRGLRRDVRGLAEPAGRLAQPLRRLAGAEEAGVHGRADARARRQARGRADAPQGRAAAEAAQDAARPLRAQAPALRRRPPALLRSRSAQALLGRARVRAAT